MKLSNVKKKYYAVSNMPKKSRTQHVCRYCEAMWDDPASIDFEGPVGVVGSITPLMVGELHKKDCPVQGVNKER